MIVLAVAGVVWLALTLTRKRTLMLAGSALLAGAWLWTAPATPALSKAAAMPQQSKATTHRGSCASLTTGMSATEVKSKMGDADETRSDEETRGPGATMMIYRDSRCAVHLLDDKVEFIE
jgi:hypothetical protein